MCLVPTAFVPRRVWQAGMSALLQESTLFSPRVDTEPAKAIAAAPAITLTPEPVAPEPEPEPTPEPEMQSPRSPECECLRRTSTEPASGLALDPPRPAYTRPRSPQI